MLKAILGRTLTAYVGFGAELIGVNPGFVIHNLKQVGKAIPKPRVQKVTVTGSLRLPLSNRDALVHLETLSRLTGHSLRRVQHNNGSVDREVVLNIDAELPKKRARRVVHCVTMLRLGAFPGSTVQCYCRDVK